ncbi:hypothetical protein [Agriterribacter sp.]|uniref:hypothetical protein n=1 Tax=Agriterribacter sp. TaxID=2821509 RepID=UPI002D1B6F09|nr:hypothetical protein [Agriterribacter sp.]HRO47682.1 hypothetical protein [Agriterribacter sp.]HRQ17663.1 hypothetical protein [Agriterribacter sp.]
MKTIEISVTSNVRPLLDMHKDDVFSILDAAFTDILGVKGREGENQDLYFIIRGIKDIVSELQRNRE